LTRSSGNHRINALQHKTAKNNYNDLYENATSFRDESTKFPNSLTIGKWDKQMNKFDKAKLKLELEGPFTPNPTGWMGADDLKCLWYNSEKEQHIKFGWDENKIQ
jgi:hypothetical protein